VPQRARTPDRMNSHMSMSAVHDGGLKPELLSPRFVRSTARAGTRVLLPTVSDATQAAQTWLPTIAEQDEAWWE
jgi:hypothetical protein